MSAWKDYVSLVGPEEAMRRPWTEDLRPPSVLAAAFRQENEFASFSLALGEDFVKKDPYYNPFLDDRVDNALLDQDPRLIASQSYEHFVWLRQKIQQEQKDRAVLAGAGLEGFLAMAAAGFTSPSTFIPVARALRVGQKVVGAGTRAAIEAGVGTTLQETLLLTSQQERTVGESAVATLGGATFGFVLGSGVSLVAKKQRDWLVKALEDDLTDPSFTNRQLMERVQSDPKYQDLAHITDEVEYDKALGEIYEQVRLELLPESYKQEAGWVRTNLQRLVSTPLIRSVTSRSPTLRATVHNLSKITPRLTGDTPFTGPRVEVRIENWKKAAFIARHDAEQYFDAYYKGGGLVDRRLLKEDLADALRMGDESPRGIDAVTRAAKRVRTVLDKLDMELREFGFLPMDGGDIFAESYLTRTYDLDALTAPQTRDAFLTELQNSALEAGIVQTQAEANSYALRIMDNILGIARSGGSNPDGLLSRMIPISDERLTELGVLIRDPFASVDRTISQVASKLELAKRFRSVQHPRIWAIRKELADLQTRIDGGLVGNAEVRQLERMKQDLQNLKAARVFMGTGARSDAAKASEILGLLGKVYEPEVVVPDRAGLRPLAVEFTKRISKEDQALGRRVLEIIDRGRTDPEAERLLARLVERGGRRFEETAQDVARAAETGDLARLRELRGEAIRGSKGALQEDTGSFLTDTPNIGDFYRKLRAETEEFLQATAADGFTLRHIEQAVLRELDEQAVEAARKGDKKELRRLQREQRNAPEDLRVMLTEATGERPSYLPGTHFWVRAAEWVKKLNVTTKLGGAPISSLADLTNLVGRYGMRQTMRAVHALAKDPEFRRSATLKNEYFAEQVAGARTQNWADLSATASGSRSAIGQTVEAILHGGDFGSRSVPGFTRITGMDQWNGFASALTGLAGADRAIGWAKRWRDGKLSALNQAELARLGIDESLARRIADQFDEHGYTGPGGARLARTERWTDEVAARAFEDAITGEVHRSVVRVGIGQRPRIFHMPLINTMFQFKSFGYASVQSILLSGLSREQKNIMQYVTAAAGFGMFVHALKEVLRDPTAPDTWFQNDDTIQRFMWNSFDRSGLFGILGDFVNIADRAGVPTGLGGVSTRYAPRSLTDVFAGPVVGTIEAGGRVISDVAGGEFDQGTVGAFRRNFAPYQNTWYLRSLFDAIEGGAERVLGIPEQAGQ